MQPGCRKAGAKAGPALPGWSDPMGAPSLISPRACGAGGAGRSSGIKQAAAFEARSLDPGKFKAEALAPSFL